MTVDGARKLLATLPGVHAESGHLFVSRGWTLFIHCGSSPFQRAAIHWWISGR